MPAPLPTSVATSALRRLTIPKTITAITKKRVKNFV